MPRECVLLFLSILLTTQTSAQEAPQATPSSQTNVNKKTQPRSPDDFLRVIPVDSLSAFIPNQDRFAERGDALGKQAKLIPFITASQAVNLLRDAVGAKGVDTKGPIVLALDRTPNLMTDEATLSFPIADRAKMLAGYGLGEADLTDDGSAVQFPPGLLGGRKDVFLRVRDRTAWISNNKETLTELSNQRSLFDQLTPQQRANWTDMDFMLYAGVGVLAADEREATVKDLGLWFKQNKKLAKDVQLVGSHFKHVLAGLSLRDGIRADVRVATDGNPKAVQALRDLVGEGESSLLGLPGGNVVAAGAIRGTTSASATMSGDFLSLPFWFIDGPLTRRRLVGLGNLLKELAFEVDETAFGLYLNEPGSERGLLSLVMVLTPRTTPQDLISEMRSLSSFVNARQARDMRISSATYDVEEVAKLIQQLSADEYVAREDAMAALRKIGPPILPELEKAMKSEDKLIAERAARLRRQIGGQLAKTTRDLFGNDTLSNMDPKFLFRRNSAKPTEVMAEIVLKPGPATYQLNKQLTGLFGANWKRVRFAILDNRVVVLFGSETKWLDETVKLVKTGKAPLQQHASIKAFRDRPTTQRLSEWHFSLSRLLGLTEGKMPLPTTETKTFSSMTVGHSEGELRTEIQFPIEDLKTIGNRW